MPAPTTTGANMTYPATVDAGGVPSWILDGSSQLAGSANNTFTANQVYLWPVEVYGVTPIGGMRWRMGTTATGKTDAGIYDVNGNLLASIGATVNSASHDNTAAFANTLVLMPGRYFLALTPGNSTDTYARGASLQVGSDPIIVRALLATNTSTGTTTPALPSATGGYAASAVAPSVAAYVVGGL